MAKNKAMAALASIATREVGSKEDAFAISELVKGLASSYDDVDVVKDFFKGLAAAAKKVLGLPEEIEEWLHEALPAVDPSTCEYGIVVPDLSDAEELLAFLASKNIEHSGALPTTDGQFIVLIFGLSEPQFAELVKELDAAGWQK